MADFRIAYDNLVTLPLGITQTVAPGDRIILEYFDQPSSSNTVRIDTAITPGVVDLGVYPSNSVMACNDTLNSCTLVLADVGNWAPKHDMISLPIAATPTLLVFEVGVGRASCWIINEHVSNSYDLVIFGGPHV